MKAIVLAAVVAAIWLLPNARPLAADFEFDGAGYDFGWEGKDTTGFIREYFKGEEKPETWKTLITVTHHPDARKLADVTGPYYEARKTIVAMQPKAHRQKGGGDTDVVLELFLGAPGKTPHLEYSIARFVETDTGVYSVVFCRKFPFAGKGDQNVDVDIAIRNGARWISELQAIPIESVRKCFAGPQANEPAAAAPVPAP